MTCAELSEPDYLVFAAQTKSLKPFLVMRAVGLREHTIFINTSRSAGSGFRNGLIISIHCVSASGARWRVRDAPL